MDRRSFEIKGTPGETVEPETENTVPYIDTEKEIKFINALFVREKQNQLN